MKRIGSKDVFEAFVSVGLEPRFVDEKMRARTFPELLANFETMKELAKKSYKRLALQLHPDRNGESDEEMKKLNAAWDFINKIKLEQSPPVVFCSPYITIHYSSGWGTSTATSSTTTTGFW